MNNDATKNIEVEVAHERAVTAPEGTVIAPEGFNAVNVYALTPSGVWLPALTIRVDTNEIVKGWTREPLRLCIGGASYQFPEDWRYHG